MSKVTGRPLVSVSPAVQVRGGKAPARTSRNDELARLARVLSGSTARGASPRV